MPTNQAWDPHQQERQKIVKAQQEQMPTSETWDVTQGYGLLAQPWPECMSDLRDSHEERVCGPPWVGSSRGKGGSVRYSPSTAW